MTPEGQSRPDPKAVIRQKTAVAASERLADLPLGRKAELLREELEDRRQDREERKTYADRIFRLVCTWLAGVFVLLFADGCGNQQGTFALPASVLIAVVSGSAAVIALMSAVAAYLFSKARLGEESGSHAHSADTAADDTE